MRYRICIIIVLNKIVDASGR